MEVFQIYLIFFIKLHILPSTNIQCIFSSNLSLLDADPKGNFNMDPDPQPCCQQYPGHKDWPREKSLRKVTVCIFKMLQYIYHLTID